MLSHFASIFKALYGTRTGNILANSLNTNYNYKETFQFLI